MADTQNKQEPDTECLKRELAKLNADTKQPQAVKAVLRMLSMAENTLNPIASTREAYVKFGKSTKDGLNELETASLAALNTAPFTDIERQCNLPMKAESHATPTASR